MRSFVAVVVLAFAAVVPAAAQAAPSPAHLAAAREVLEAAGSRETFQKSIDQQMEMMREQMAQLPEMVGGAVEMDSTARAMQGQMMERMLQRMAEFYARHMTYEVVEADFAAVYAQFYTEAELREMAAFYRTPLGRRLAEQQVPVMRAMQERIQERLNPFMGELFQTMMQDVMPAGALPGAAKEKSDRPAKP